MDFEMSTAIALSDLPLHWPTKDGRRLHKAIGYRWAHRGLRGVKLRSLTLPGVGRATCRAWLDQFIRELNEIGDDAQQDSRPRRRGLAGVDAAAATARRNRTNEGLAKHGLAPLPDSGRNK
jgi:hypothetical protein